MKTLLSAGIIREFRFSSVSEAVFYLDRRRLRHLDYRIVDSYLCDDNSFVVVILSAYNNSPLFPMFGKMPEAGDLDEEA